MEYLGSKKKLSDWIFYNVKKETGLQKGIFWDLFSGSGEISKKFSYSGFKVFSNDQSTYSYHIANSHYSDFGGVGLENYLNILNNLQPKVGWITKNYTKEFTKDLKIPRNYFSVENAKQIDAIRDQIENWYKSGKINSQENSILIRCLIDALDRVSNIAGNWEAFLKKKKETSNRILKLNVPDWFSKSTPVKGDAFEILKTSSGDILYLDPPYNTRNYQSMFHIPESIAKWNKPTELRGVSGKPVFEHITRIGNKQSLERLLIESKKSPFDWLVVSLNSESTISEQEVIDILKTVSVYRIEHKRYANKSGMKKTVFELLFVHKIQKP